MKYLLILLLLTGCHPRVTNLDQLVGLLETCKEKFNEDCSFQPIPNGVSDEVMLKFYMDYYNSKKDQDN